ncbi:hypothetical protein QBC46DRAFT_419424 [Diplogelasinospora grovesii]|uniref:Uncharacterized protein n=1 Tax=Diplogelasinospora grovesii TaxID=303347 RepID=A0AAN6MZP4_9PEZI|nr:hypothetical protein QBC46DRAFT_419424 [Diplogelasinospora grovesii]
MKLFMMLLASAAAVSAVPAAQPGDVLPRDALSQDAVNAVLKALIGGNTNCRQVPKTVTLEVLAKIAIIVDYYKIPEALSIAASLWIKALKKSLPNSLRRDVILWILAAWIFEDATMFRQVTKAVILRNRKDLEIPHDPPIPPAVIRLFSWMNAAAWIPFICRLPGTSAVRLPQANVPS